MAYPPGNYPDPLPVKGTDETRIPGDNDVVWNGYIVGSDPDPNVQITLLKEAQSGAAE